MTKRFRTTIPVKSAFALSVLLALGACSSDNDDDTEQQEISEAQPVSVTLDAA